MMLKMNVDNFALGGRSEKQMATHSTKKGIKTKSRQAPVKNKDQAVVDDTRDDSDNFACIKTLNKELEELERLTLGGRSEKQMATDFKPPTTHYSRKLLKIWCPYSSLNPA